MPRPVIHSLGDLTRSDILAALPSGVDYHFVTSGGEQSLTLTAVSESNPAGPNVEAHGTGHIAISALSDLVDIVAGADFGVLPTEIPISGGLSLTAMSVVIDSAEHDIVSLVLEVSCNTDWPLLPGLFTLEQVVIDLQIFFPLSPPQRVWTHVGGRFDFAGSQFDAGVSVPELELDAELAPDSTIPVGTLLAHLLPGLGLDSLQINDLRFWADPRQHAYALRGQVVESWSVIPNFALNELRLEVLGEGSAAPDGSLEAVVEVGGVPLFLGADYSSSSGWHFAGGTHGDQQIAIGTLVEDLVHKLGIALPHFADQLTLDRLWLDFDTATSTFRFQSTWDEANQLDFDFYHQHPTLGRVALASYLNQSGGTQSLRSLVQPVSSTLANAIPSGLSLTVKDALFADCQPGGTSKLLFAVSTGLGLDLAHLPLVGKLFAANRAVQLDLQILAASASFSAAEVSALGQLGGQRGSWPVGALGEGIDLRSAIHFGGESHTVDLPVKLDQKTGTVTPDSTKPASGAHWYHLQKSFGPVELERVGLAYQDSELELLLDASFSLGGFALALEGLGVSSPLTHFDPTFHLDGLGMDFSEGPIQVLGAFLHRQVTEGDTTFDEYDGALMVEAELGGEQLGLHAIGSYARYEGHPSLFLYLAVDFPLGGPPFFFVEGLAGGFGYNRSLTMPTIDQVASFPLVAEAVAGDFPDTSSPSQLVEVVEQELGKLDHYISPTLGAGFVAVGVKFSSFKLLESFALLTVELGDRFEVDLLGLSDLSVPPEVEDGISPLANMELLLEASLIPAEGFLGVQAQLARSSYILSKDCRLTGGFAFDLWFAGEHAGDFVVTLGGYHPKFQVPSYYPKVPRLGFDWRIDDHAFIKGGCYFALCAHALMAGGALEAGYNNGHVHASFRAGADFLICWKPYHYEIDAYIDISASCGILGPVDVGADLDIWGPDFGGKARIKILFIHVTVHFGDQGSTDPLAIAWSHFQSSFLPDAHKVCTINCGHGLRRKVKSGANEYWVVNPKSFAFETDSIIPSKQAHRGTGSTSLPTGNACGDFGIAPMGVASNELEVSQRITLTYGPNHTPVEQHFTFEPLTKKAPSALWGEPDVVSRNPVRLAPPSVNRSRFVTDASGHDPLSGYRITPASPPTPGTTQDIDTRALQFDTHKISGAYAWSSISAFAAQAESDAARRTAIRTSLDSPSVGTARDTMLSALGFDPADDVSIDAGNLVDAFVIAPQVN